MLSENVIISIGTEFIENENEEVSKQDCELNAAKRLLERIKKNIQDYQFVYKEMHYMQQSHL